MKQTWLFKILSHPILQLISFSIILINGEVFAAPYLWYVRYAASDGELFAFVGWAAICVTLASLAIKRFSLQLWGLIIMWISLSVFYSRSLHKASMLVSPGTELTVLLFIAMSICVVIKFKKWKNY